MELYKKYRPKNFKQFIGNENIINSIEAKINNNSLPHAILFTGDTGTGKTTLSRIIANKLDCIGLDYQEIDSGVDRGIDAIRKIREGLRFKPLSGKSKVVVFDEAHKIGTGGSSMKNDAQNALLKVLEDTPSSAYIILCTTNPEMLIKPIKGRCTEYKLNSLTDELMFKLLKKIIRKEKKEVPEEVLTQIILNGQGLPRNTIQILERVIDLEQSKMLKAAEEESDKQNKIIELARALLKGESWKNVSNILKGLRQEDPESIRRLILSYMSKVLLDNGNNNNAYIIMDRFEEPTYNIGFDGVILNCRRITIGE